MDFRTDKDENGSEFENVFGMNMGTKRSVTGKLRPYGAFISGR